MKPIADDEHTLPVLGARLKARGAQILDLGVEGGIAQRSPWLAVWLRNLVGIQ